MGFDVTLTMTGHTTDVTWAIYKLLEDNKESFNIRQVFDGDRIVIPETPVICVTAGDKRRELYATGRTTRVEFTVYVMIYHKRIQTVEKNDREAQELAEALEDFLHLFENSTLDGLVIHGYVTRSEPGYANRSNSVMRTTRLTWEGESRHSLPMS